MHPELINLAAELDDGELQKIADQVIEEYKSDEDSRKEWISMHASWLDLYYQRDKTQGPWENSSDESMPILAEGCNQFHARAFPALFPGWHIIKGEPAPREVAEEDLTRRRERADRIGRHMSWQLLKKDLRYKRDFDSFLLALPLHGSFYRKIYFDPMKRFGNVAKNVRPVDLVLPYGTGPRAIEDIDRKTEIIWMGLNETKIRAREGYFIRPGEVYQRAEKNEQDQAHDDAHGLSEPQDPETNGYCMILEQHRLLDLDEDGISEPYIVTVDRQSEKVLRIAIRYEVDEQGQPTDQKRPIEYYQDYVYLPNPDGVYGLGLGHLVGQMNKAINKLLRQTIDAGTLRNVLSMSGFINEASGIPGGELELVLGKFKKIRADGDIRQAIYQLQANEPSAMQYNVLQGLMTRADRFQMVTEALTGTTDKILQPTALLALIDQGLQPFTAVYERVVSCWTGEIAKFFRLNKKYLSDETFTSKGPDGPQTERVTTEDYQDDIGVAPVADPKMATDKQKLAKSDAEWNFESTNPLCVNNQTAFYYASRRRAEALGVEDISAILPEPQQKEEQRIDDPKVENMGALMPMPQIPQVFPDQNHLQHIKEHEGFLAGPYSQKLTKEGADALQKHVQMHWAYLYGVTETNAMDEVIGGTVGNSPMAGEPGNAMVSPEFGGEAGAGMGPGPGLGPDQSVQGPV